MRKFLLNLLSSESTTSSKRFITLVIALHFVITSFLVSFFVFYLIIYTPKGTVNKDLIDTLMAIFEYDFYIIVSGLGFVTIDNMGAIMVERAKAKLGGVEGPPIGGMLPGSLEAKSMKVDENELNK